MANEQHFTIIHNQWTRDSKRVPLPAMLGSDPTCDVIINANAVAPFAYAIGQHENKLQVIHIKNGQEVTPQALERYGIQLSRPLLRPDGSKPQQGQWREWLAKEELWLARQPRWLRMAAAGFLRQKLRFALWGGVIAAIVAFTLVPAEHNVVDFSDVPIAMKMDHVSSQIIGVTTQRVGYEKGAMLTVDANQEQAKQALLLSFRAAKLDIGRELRILTASGVVYESAPMANCIKQFCEIKVRIPPGALQAGTNQIRLEHDPRGGFYIIGDLLLRPLPKIKPDEIRRVERWEQIANRAYNERDIVPENLVQVKKQLDQAISFLNTREGADATRARIEAFRAEAEEAFQNEVKDRWAKVDINQKLTNFDSALFHLDRLRGLFPDTSSKEHQAVQNRMSQIKEMQK